jgi:squalene-hopene/tetraprenyl-beta-curcumene cyclase
LEALRAAGAAADDPAVQSALRFVRRCQNFEPDLRLRDEMLDDGGFHFILDDPVRNKAGMSGTDRHGRLRFASYGSATVDGLRAFALCDVPANDPGMLAAWEWMKKNFIKYRHPGEYELDRLETRDAVYFYYCHGLMQALATEHAEQLLEGKRRYWAEAIAQGLLARQGDDGSWRNSAVDVREDDPLVATSLAAGALVRCRAILE